MNVNDFHKKQRESIPIKMVTCYDYWTAKILSQTNIDCVLVGDSAAMVMHGYSTTVSADSEMLQCHIRAVRKGLGEKGFMIGDLPFLSYRKSMQSTMQVVDEFMKAGANAVKLEGVLGNEDIIKNLVTSGIPVMGHIGFTPQSINSFGNSYVRGKEESDAQQLINAAKLLEQLGCFSVVLECIPAVLAKEITQAISIPTIGIGAGPDTSGQVLVLQDLLGADPEFNPKFLKKYLDGFGLIRDAVNQYCEDVDRQSFPAVKHCYNTKKVCES